MELTRPGKGFYASHMKKARNLPFATFMLLLAASVSASAHHSFGAEYDANKPITLTGIVTKVEWTNPHSFFYLDVKDASGKVSNWKLEGFPPNVLYRTGWKKDVTLKQGDEITVTGWHARDGSDWGHSREVTFKDGKKLFFGPPAGTGDGGNAPAVADPTK
jgi:hypothetical protein